MARSRSRSASSTPRRWYSKAWRYCLYAGLTGLLALLVAVGMAWSSLPEISELRTRESLGQVIRVRAVDGSIIASLGPIYGQWIGYRDIPPVMVDAMVAVEDRRFRSHIGFDPIGLARVAYNRVTTGGRITGASTITQQLARNIFLTNKRTFGRKFRELILALAMERKYSKDDLLELYLNRVYFGGGAYGIDAASRRFFDHPAKQLSLAESAIIAGLVKAPSNYSPTADAKAAIGRAGVVLKVMADAGKISPALAAATRPDQVKLAAEPQQNSVRYFTDWALPQLDGMIDEPSKAIDVWTTLDLTMQDAADKAIKSNTPGGAQGALVSLDRDGAVRAMVGGRDYVTSIYNRSTQAVRQPGSAFKLFVYLAALESGMTPDAKVVDEEVDIDGWKPRNSSGRFAGEMDLRTAFTYSVNTVAAKIGAEVGTGAISNMARRFGITTPVNTQPSMVLGTSDTRLIDMTRAYAAVAAKGLSVTPYGITKVTTDQGAVLYKHPAADPVQLVDPWVAAAMTDLLQTAVNTGTGKAAQIGRPVAGKTGTTSSNKDGWFMGFSSGLTTGVWMGRDDARTVAGLQGGRAPATAFAAYMRVATAKRPVEQFDTEVTLPEWQLETEEQSYFGDPDQGQFVDENGIPVETPAPPEPLVEDKVAPETLDQKWIDEVTGKTGT
ncbi:MAG: PBP1A family penicillin-binding protein [Chakrabartia sp.]